MDPAPLDTVIAVVPTPFLDDGEVDVAGFSDVLRLALDGGLTAVTVAGNTGEFEALSAVEVARLADVAAETTAGDAALLVGIGGDLATARQLATGVAAAGILGVMIHEPAGPFRSADGWLRYHAEIANAAPGLAIVPYIRDPAVSPADVETLVRAAGNVVAVKYAVPDPVRYSDMVRDAGPGVLWICGLAESWAPFFSPAGPTAFTSGLAVVAPDLSLGLLRQIRAHNWSAALRIWSFLRPFEALRARRLGAANVPAVKEALAQIGVIGRAVRPPISELGPEERAEIAEILHAWKERKGNAVA